MLFLIFRRKIDSTPGKLIWELYLEKEVLPKY